MKLIDRWWFFKLHVNPFYYLKLKLIAVQQSLYKMYVVPNVIM